MWVGTYVTPVWGMSPAYPFSSMCMLVAKELMVACKSAGAHSCHCVLVASVVPYSSFTTWGSVAPVRAYSVPAIVIVLACVGCCSVESHVTVRVSVAVAAAEAEVPVALALSAKEGRGSSKHASATLVTVAASFFVRFMDVSLLLRSATRAALVIALVFSVSYSIVVYVVINDFF
jgi:hypothetical protein